MKLNISEELSLPVDFLTLRKVLFGGSGSGKTTLGRVMFEEATKAGVLCGVIDLKADWWGLKSSADGKREGIPVVIFGGEHKDVPIVESGGAELAEIVVDLKQPFVVDLEEFSKGKQLKFLGAFFERLYDKNRDPLVLFCDEADRYMSQKPMSPEANICLGAGEDIAKRGRKHGIFPVFITQRNASLNKGVSELCDVAIVFRTPGPRDQEAVEDWFATKATKEQMEIVMAGLAGMETGTATFCSAHPQFKLFKECRVREAETFDSSATPEIGKARIVPKKLAKVELSSLGERMKATIEHVKANDPSELKREVARLKHELANHTRSIRPEVKTVTEFILDDEAKKAMRSLATVLDVMTTSFVELRGKLEPSIQEIELIQNRITKLDLILKARQASQKLEQDPNGPRALLTRLPRPAPVPRKDGELWQMVGKCEKAILTTLSHYPEGCTIGKLALLSGYSISGSFKNALGALRSAGYIAGENTGVMQILEAANEQGPFDPIPEPAERAKYWLNFPYFGKAERAILEVLLNHPEGLDIHQLSAHAGYEVSGSFKNSLGALRTAGVLVGKNTGLMSASIELL